MRNYFPDNNIDYGVFMIGKILKINILSLLALPFLLLATLSELLARALEKLPLIVRMICISIITLAIADTLRNNTGLDASLEVVILISVCAVIILIAIWVLSVFSSLLNVIWHCIIVLFNKIYDISYRLFLSLNEACETDYSLLTMNRSHILFSVFCICYTLLHGIDWLIIHLLWLSHALSIVAGISFAALVLQEASNRMVNDCGSTLSAYLQSGDTASVLYEGILLLSVILPVVIILLSLGREWHDWAIELRMDSMSYDEYVDSIQDSEVSFLDNIEEPDEEALEMQEILNDHTETIDQLCDEIEDILALKNDTLLRNRWNEYLCDLYELIDEIENVYHNEIPHKEFKAMLYRVRRLELQRNDLFDQMDEILALAENPAFQSSFFNGCNSRTQLDKRYRELCKIYHPDAATGDQELFIEMQQEYKELKGQFTD